MRERVRSTIGRWLGIPRLATLRSDHVLAHRLPDADGLPVAITYPDGCKAEPLLTGGWVFTPYDYIEGEAVGERLRSRT